MRLTCVSVHPLRDNSPVGGRQDHLKTEIQRSTFSNFVLGLASI